MSSRYWQWIPPTTSGHGRFISFRRHLLQPLFLHPIELPALSHPSSLCSPILPFLYHLLSLTRSPLVIALRYHLFFYLVVLYLALAGSFPLAPSFSHWVLEAGEVLTHPSCDALLYILYFSF